MPMSSSVVKAICRAPLSGKGTEGVDSILRRYL